MLEARRCREDLVVVAHRGRQPRALEVQRPQRSQQSERHLLQAVALRRVLPYAYRAQRVAGLQRVHRLEVVTQAELERYRELRPLNAGSEPRRCVSCRLRVPPPIPERSEPQGHRVLLFIRNQPACRSVVAG